MNTSYYTAKSSYFNLINERVIQDENMRKFFTACNIVMEGSNDLSPLNEGVGDNLKNGWNKLVQFIKEMVAKFIESITNLFSSEKGWLEKYKQIILTKKPAEDATIDDFPPYDIGYQRITGATVPQFNPDSDAARLKDNESFIRYVCPAIGPVFKEIFPDGAESKVSDGLTKYFQGGEPRNGVKMTDLNFTDMYNFCYNYKKLTELVQKDQKAIDSSTTAANNAITKAIESLTPEEKNQTAATPKETGAEKKDDNQTSQSTTSSTSSTSSSGSDKKTEKDFENEINALKNEINNKRSSYKSMSDEQKTLERDKIETKKKNLEGKAKQAGVNLDLSGKDFSLEFVTLYNSNDTLYDIITEATPKISGGKTEAPKTPTNTAATQDKNTAHNSGNTATTQDNTDKAAANAMKNNKNDSQAALTEISNKIKVYQDVTNAIFTAKLAVITEIFKAYMSIMRAHVRSIVGKEADTTSVAPSVASDNKNSVYSEVRKNDIEKAQQNYRSANGDEAKRQALSTYTATIRRIYGNNTYDNAFKDSAKGKSDELTTNDYFANLFMTNYNAINNQ